MSDPYVESLRRGFKSRTIPGSFTIVIFGATGDLTHRKLIPALYNLYINNELPESFKIIGFARRDKDDELWRSELEQSNKENSRSGNKDEVWEKFQNEQLNDKQKNFLTNEISTQYELSLIHI